MILSHNYDQTSGTNSPSLDHFCNKFWILSRFCLGLNIAHCQVRHPAKLDCSIEICAPLCRHRVVLSSKGNKSDEPSINSHRAAGRLIE